MKKKLTYAVLEKRYKELIQIANDRKVFEMKEKIKQLEKELFEANLLIVELLKERKK